jgi:hypothetical protein
LIATPYGVLHAEKAPRPVPDPLNFARRARFAPWPRVAGLEARDMGQVGPPLLRVACAGGGTAVELVIAPPDAEAAASQLAALRSRQREVPCPS